MLVDLPWEATIFDIHWVAFIPFHFAGHFQGKDLRDKYPEGADPYILGEAANTAMTYGYDSVTQMQETKCSLCRITKA